MKATHLISLLLGSAALAVAARATLITLDTSSLAGGTYFVDFQLNDGSQTGDGNNTAVIQKFSFGGGAATGAGVAFGGITGDLYSKVTLTDTTPFNEFFQSFTAGSFLSFDVELTNNPDTPQPDAFGFALLDTNLFNLPTNSSNGADTFLSVNLTGTRLVYSTAAGVGGVPAPRVPETGSTLLVASLGLLGLAGIRRLVGVPLAA